MAKQKPTRYIELFDDISNHVFQWATDEDWGKLPPKVNVALTTLMNELKIAKALQEAGHADSDEDSIATDKRRFVALFKKKHVEAFDLAFTDAITPINQVNMKRVITDLKAEGGKYEEFIEWFFDDYCTLEENKKFMPPAINFMCSNYVVKKYLYNMKDKLRIRRENIDMEKVRTMLLEIALPMRKRINNPAFEQKIMDFDTRLISATKFFDLMKAFARKCNDKECLDACAVIEGKMAAAKKSGI